MNPSETPSGQLGLIPEADVYGALGIRSAAAQWRARKSGALPPMIRVGRRRFVRVATWAAWLEARERGETLPPVRKPGRGRPRKPVNPLAPLSGR